MTAYKKNSLIFCSLVAIVLVYYLSPMANLRWPQAEVTRDFTSYKDSSRILLYQCPRYSIDGQMELKQYEQYQQIKDHALLAVYEPRVYIVWPGYSEDCSNDRNITIDVLKEQILGGINQVTMDTCYVNASSLGCNFPFWI